MTRDDHVHNFGISANEYADCNLDPQNLHSGKAWASLLDGVLIGHITDALALCRYLIKNKLYRYIKIELLSLWTDSKDHPKVRTRKSHIKILKFKCENADLTSLPEMEICRKNKSHFAKKDASHDGGEDQFVIVVF